METSTSMCCVCVVRLNHVLLQEGIVRETDLQMIVHVMRNMVQQITSTNQYHIISSVSSNYLRGIINQLRGPPTHISHQYDIDAIVHSYALCNSPTHNLLGN